MGCEQLSECDSLHGGNGGQLSAWGAVMLIDILYGHIEGLGMEGFAGHEDPMRLQLWRDLMDLRNLLDTITTIPLLVVE